MSLLLLLLFSWIILFLIFYRYHSGNYYSLQKEKFQDASKLIDESGVLSDSDLLTNNSPEPEPEPKSKQLPLIPINVKPDIEVKNNFVADDNVETKPDVKNCLFVPRGDTVQSCIDRCQFIEDRHLWGGSNCTNDNCTQICTGCRKKDDCKWIKKDSMYEDAKIPNPPPKQEITSLAGDSNVKVIWSSLENEKQGNKAFLIKYFKTYKPFEGVRVANVLVDSEEQKNYTYTIDNLENNEYYSIALFALNDTDISPVSNIEQVSPKENSTIISN